MMNGDMLEIIKKKFSYPSLEQVWYSHEIWKIWKVKI